MDSELQKKQQYLFKQIIQGNYPPQKFQQFLVAKNPKCGDDLNEWSLSQLKKVVFQFKTQQDSLKIQKYVIDSSIKSFRSEQSPTKFSNKLQNQTDLNKNSPFKQAQKKQIFNINTVNESNFQTKNITPAASFYKQDQTNYKTNFQCQKLVQTQFFKDNLKSRIVKCNKNEGGIFQKAFISYIIQTTSLTTKNTWKVQRRFTDFVWLKQTLQLLHTGSIIPPIAKKGNFRKYDDKHIKKRVYILEIFLDKIINNPDIKADPITQAFLTIAENKNFDNYKSQYKKQTQAPIDKIRNLSGQINVNLSKQLITLNQESKIYFTKIQPQVKKIYKDFKGVATLIENTCDLLNSIALNCKGLAQKDGVFRKFCNLPPQPVNFYSIMNEVSQKYKQILSQQAKIFRKQIYSIAKYQTLCIQNILGGIQKFLYAKQNFYTINTNLTKKKQKLYSQGNMNKWQTTSPLTKKPQKLQAFGLMLPKQTNQLLNSRDILALYNQNINRQIKKYMLNSHKQIANYLQQFFMLELALSKKQSDLWQMRLNKCRSIKDQSSLSSKASSEVQPILNQQSK